MATRTRPTHSPGAAIPSAAPRGAPGALVREMSPRGAGVAEKGPEVVLEARPAIDFVVSLIGDTEQELLPADAAWRQTSSESLSASLRRDLARAFSLGDESHKSVSGWACLMIIVPRREIRTAADVVAFASQVTPRELVRNACEDEDLEASRALVERYFAGETDLLEELVASTPGEVQVAIRRLLEDPEGELRALRRVLRAWQERFAEIEPHVARMHERDILDRQAALARLPLVDFVEQVTNGLRWTPAATVRTVYLTPSYFARPYNYTFQGEGWHLFAYPLAETALDGDPGAVPPSTVRLFRALGDDGRLRILRHLADGDLYLTEIADRMSLSKPTAKHHLAQLRAAGLVTVISTGGLTYYSLRRDRVAEVGLDLTRYLGATPS